ncbi:EVE domain-containing protein [Leptolyngbya sp. PL-A3]
MKSEPDVYSINDLERDQETLWDGVRNYQARNFMRSMEPGDWVFFYHSNTQPPGVVGLMTVAQSGVPDPTQFDPASEYYDPKSTQDNPRWQTVTLRFLEQFPTMVPLEQLRQTFSEDELWVVRRGNRLSVMPVDDPVAEKILAIARHS